MKILELISVMRLTSNHSMRLLSKLPDTFDERDVLKAAREIVAEDQAPIEDKPA